MAIIKKSKLSHLQGKQVVIVYFFSDSYKINLAPQLFKELQKDDKGVVLIALKLDDKSPARAAAFFKKMGADLSKWCVGVDPDGKWLSRSFGLRPATKNIKRSQAVSIDPSGKVSLLDSFTTDNKIQIAEYLNRRRIESTPFLSSEKVPKGISAIHKFESGDLSGGIKACAAIKGKDLDPAAIKEMMNQHVDKSLDELTQALRNDNTSSGKKYIALKRITVLVKDFPRSKKTIEAKKAIKEISGKKEIKAEKAAEDLYYKINEDREKKLNKSKGSSDAREIRAKIKDRFKDLIKKYPNTLYGRFLQQSTEIL